jgi:hypothetical protein
MLSKNRIVSVSPGETKKMKDIFRFRQISRQMERFLFEEKSQLFGKNHNFEIQEGV